MTNPKNRYARQTILPEIGKKGQKALSDASILCIGAGGLGCPALLYLAAAGVGRMGIVDFDSVEESNLQRQILFTMDQIGENKAVAAAQRLKDLNPEIIIEPYPETLTSANALDLFENYDLIIDGTDNFSSKFLINDAALKAGKPFVYGSILGFEGQLAVFGTSGGPCYRCLFPHPPRENIPNCAEAGIIGALAGMIGTAQAMEAVKLLTAHESFQPLMGRVQITNAKTMETKTLNLPKNPDCPVCTKPQEEIILEPTSPKTMPPQITIDQARETDGALMIDVRETDEWNVGHIEGARHIPLSIMMQGDIPDLPKDQNIIIYCKSGQRSLYAQELLKARGHENTANLIGGYEAWLQSA